MTHQRTCWAALAASLLTIGGTFLVLQQSAPVAYGLEQVISAYDKVRTLHIQTITAARQVTNEFWIQCDEAGQVTKARYFLPGTEDGDKLITWTPQRTEIWFQTKRAYLLMQTSKIQPMMQRLLDQSQPQLLLRSLEQEQKSGKVEIQSRQARGEQGPLIEVTHKDKARRELYHLEPKTGLIIRMESFQAKNGPEKLVTVTEFKDYNAPIEEKMFSLREELPSDVRIADQLNQVPGVAQGSLSDAEAAAETVRQFLQALKDQDYKKAGLIYGGQMENEARAGIGKVTITAIFSVGPAQVQTNWVKRGYRVPCKVEVANPDGRKTVLETAPYVRPGDDEAHPNNWNITGGIDFALQSAVPVLPDNAKYAQMSPREAAAAFFKSCAQSNWNETLKFMPFGALDSQFDRLKDYLGGLKVQSLGEPYQSNNYEGWYVPYEIYLSDTVAYVRVSNTNAAGRYVIVGLSDSHQHPSEEVRWTAPPAVLANNEAYARLSPGEVVRAYWESIARHDWLEMAKFAPESDIKDTQRQLAGLEKRGEEFRSRIPVVLDEAPLWSEQQKEWLVKCRMPGAHKKWNLALHNDNPAGRFLFDGGL